MCRDYPAEGQRSCTSGMAQRAGLRATSSYRIRLTMKPNLEISTRAATADDLGGMTEVFLRARKELMPFAPLAHSDYAVCRWIADWLIPAGGVTVAADTQGFDRRDGGHLRGQWRVVARPALCLAAVGRSWHRRAPACPRDLEHAFCRCICIALRRNARRSPVLRAARLRGDWLSATAARTKKAVPMFCMRCSPPRKRQCECPEQALLTGQKWWLCHAHDFFM